MDMKLFKKIIDECAFNRLNFRVLTLHLHGEPLLDKHLIARIKYAKEKGIKEIQVSTNSSLLGTSAGLSLLESGLDVLTVSLDGMSSASYEAIRCGLSFDDVMQNISTFLHEKQTRRFEKPRVFIQVIKTSLNKNELNLVKKHFKLLADEIVFVPLEPWKAMSSEMPANQSPKFRMLCPHPFFYFPIFYDGRVSACCNDFDASLVMGDLNVSTIKDIWHGEKYQQLRKRAYYNKLTEYPLCKKCQNGGW